MALRLDVLANTRQFVSEMKKSGASVEDITDALDEMAKDGDDAAEKLERSFRDVAKEAKDTGRDIERVASDTSRAFKDTGRDIKRDVGKGLQDVKDEASQSGREAAASFSGEWSDVGDFVQETVANGLGGFGPLGAAAGIAAAAGIGILTSEIIKQQEEASKLRKRLTSAYQDAAAEGRNFLDQAQITADVLDLLYNPEREEERKRLQEDAKRLGIETGEVYEANAGSLEAQRVVQEAINDLIESEEGTYTTLRDGIERINPEVKAMADRWGAVTKETKAARDATDEYQEYVKRAEERNREQIQRTRDAAQSRYEGLAQLYSKPIKATIDVGVNDRTRGVVDRIVRDINGRIASIQVSAGIGGRSMT